MRLLVVIPHYFGPGDPANSSPFVGSYIEPLGRIAALSETIASLHRHFGPYRNTLEGREIASTNVLDIVIVTMRGRNLLNELGVDPGIYTVDYVEGAPTRIPFHVAGLLKQRLGRYDFYALMEDDLAIHDPDFFAKLAWFRRNFGPRALLAPTRVETASTGTPGKVIVDPVLSEIECVPFRRPGQASELRALWHGQERGFALPFNPHAACYFLTQEQLAHWVAQPSFDDGDASWIGPLESAVTLGVGKVFDIYKAVLPDPFFLEIHHFGSRFAQRHPPAGRRYGDPPLIAIAQGAVRAALADGRRLAPDAAASGASALPPVIGAWLAEETSAESSMRLGDLIAERNHLRAQVADQALREKSLRWLIPATMRRLLRALAAPLIWLVRRARGT